MSKTQIAGPPTAYHLSDDHMSRMERHTYMRRRPEGETDVSWFWQDSLVNEPKGRQSKTHEGDMCQPFDP